MCIRDREIIKWFDDQPFTVAFVDGNHENFDLLDNFPYEEKWNGRVQRISNHVFHLCRGEIYIMEGHSIFTFGGATSVDKMYRTENISWWKAENASKSEMDYGVNTLESVHWNVDYIITHTAVSYTHLDVYKRQLILHQNNFFQYISMLALEKSF